MPRGGQAGNNNAGKAKRWSNAIDKALKQYNEGDVKAGHALDRIAMRLVDKAVTTTDPVEFDKAIAVIGDRIEGKPSQSVELSTPEGVSFNMNFTNKIEE